VPFPSPVAVGTPVSRGPPHGAVLAELPHTALAVDDGVKPLVSQGWRMRATGSPALTIRFMSSRPNGRESVLQMHAGVLLQSKSAIDVMRASSISVVILGIALAAGGCGGFRGGLDQDDAGGLSQHDAAERLFVGEVERRTRLPAPMSREELHKLATECGVDLSNDTVWDRLLRLAVHSGVASRASLVSLANDMSDACLRKTRAAFWGNTDPFTEILLMAAMLQRFPGDLDTARDCLLLTRRLSDAEFLGGVDLHGSTPVEVLVREVVSTAWPCTASWAAEPREQLVSNTDDLLRNMQVWQYSAETGVWSVGPEKEPAEK